MNRREARLAKLGQRTQLMTSLMILVMGVLLIQLWLVTVALESYMAADLTMAIPTFCASGLCLAINLGLLRLLYRVDRDRE